VIFQRPALYPKQVAAIFAPERYAIIEATPKCGKTAGCMAWLVEQAAKGRAGRAYWWVAPVMTQAEMVFERLKHELPRRGVVAKDTTKTLRLVNHATIWFKSADTPDSLFGEDVGAAVIDEAPRCKEEAWHAVRTTLTATGWPIRIIGNVKGRRNWAYRLARRAEAGEPDMHYARLTALDAIEAGLFHEAELDDARRQLPAAVFHELYFAEASDDQGNPFGLAAIRACVAPRSRGAPLVWGWDLAKSVDWTVGIALDGEGAVCQVERFQRPWEETFRIIREATGDTPALVDSTGVGDPVLERLQRTADRSFRGFHFSATSKQQLMEGLAVALQRGRVRIPEGPIVAELEAFEYRYTRTGVQYRAPEGVHDDCVMALALAVQVYADVVDRAPFHMFGGSEARDSPEAEQARRQAHAEALAAYVRVHGVWVPGDPI
jgi:hypothetical protein